jgi:MFS family permease
MAAASVAVYMYAVGLGALLFGPAADRFGRRWTLAGSTALFVGLSLACMFAPSIQGVRPAAGGAAARGAPLLVAMAARPCARPSSGPPLCASHAPTCCHNNPHPHSPPPSALVAARAVQGFVVSSCSTTANAVLADIFAPAARGRAMGIAAIPFLVGFRVGGASHGHRPPC